MNSFNEREFLSICNQFNVEPYCEEITIEYKNSSFFNKMKKSVEKDRRGEVVFCVVRPNGKIITVTCEEYPGGVFRIPTGGIFHGEDIVEAVFRETKEELGLEVKLEIFAGVLKIKFVHGENCVMFYSYLFIMKEMGGRLLVDASDNEVSEVSEVEVEELKAVADTLNSIAGKWADWGRFRYATTEAVYRVLKSHGY
ncbi:MAG: NUDIX hydrolase [Clostridia bacterium]|nr:NUDIX hydrolase [Clostridia bacterium]